MVSNTRKQLEDKEKMSSSQLDSYQQSDFLLNQTLCSVLPLSSSTALNKVSCGILTGKVKK